MYQSHWTGDAEGGEVEEWFRQQLTARGWELHSSRRGSVDRPGEVDFYRRGAAHFILGVWRENGTTHYDITFADTSPHNLPSRQKGLLRRPDSSALAMPVGVEDRHSQCQDEQTSDEQGEHPRPRTPWVAFHETRAVARAIRDDGERHRDPRDGDPQRGQEPAIHDGIVRLQPHAGRRSSCLRYSALSIRPQGSLCEDRARTQAPSAGARDKLWRYRCLTRWYRIRHVTTAIAGLCASGRQLLTSNVAPSVASSMVPWKRAWASSTARAGSPVGGRWVSTSIRTPAPAATSAACPGVM